MTEAKICKYIFLIISFYFLVNQNSNALMLASSASLSGYVTDSSTNETLISATVTIKGTSLGGYTNKSGFFSVSYIPEGKYAVSVSMIGYAKLIDTITFKANQSIKRTFVLSNFSITTKEVEVEANREDEKREISISKIDIPMQQIKNIRIGGESDVFRTLQMLPGILTSSQLSSALFVRGGSPDQNLVLLDGSTVYNPSHLFGFISTFNPDAIKDVELIKGGFPAEYGDRLSAVLNITQKDGDQKDFDGKAAIGFISSHLSLEGPIGNGSWFIGGRRTYLELIKAFIHQDPASPLPNFDFYDLNGKISQSWGDNDKFFLSGFMGSDALNLSSGGVSMNLNMGNQMVAARWTHILGSDLFSTVNLSYSKYINDFSGDQAGYQFLVNNSISDITLKGNLEWYNSEKLTTKFGFESIYYTFSYLQNFTGNTDSTEQGNSGGMLNLNVHDINNSAYGQANYQVTDLISIQGGLRANYWSLSKVFSLDPRLSARWQLTEDIAIKGAWGIYHQNLHLATQPDFSFFDTWLPTDASIPPSSASHYILSLETQPSNDINFNFDVYYKQMNNINQLNMNSLREFNTTTVSDIFYVGNAQAYGAEIFLQKKTGRLTGWIGYALGWIFDEFPQLNNGAEFRPKYDRLHDLKIVAQYEINDTWDAGANFTFQTGQSYTGATSRFQSILIGENYGSGKIVPSQLYGLRLPPSIQLNLNASYSFKTFGKPSKLILDIFNALNRRDIWFRYYNTRTPITTVQDVRLLPIIPTISYEINFL